MKNIFKFIWSKIKPSKSKKSAKSIAINSQTEGFLSNCQSIIIPQNQLNTVSSPTIESVSNKITKDQTSQNIEQKALIISTIEGNIITDDRQNKKQETNTLTEIKQEYEEIKTKQNYIPPSKSELDIIKSWDESCFLLITTDLPLSEIIAIQQKNIFLSAKSTSKIEPANEEVEKDQNEQNEAQKTISPSGFIPKYENIAGNQKELDQKEISPSKADFDIFQDFEERYFKILTSDYSLAELRAFQANIIQSAKSKVENSSSSILPSKNSQEDIFTPKIKQENEEIAKNETDQDKEQEANSPSKAEQDNEKITEDQIQDKDPSNILLSKNSQEDIFTSKIKQENEQITENQNDHDKEQETISPSIAGPDNEKIIEDLIQDKEQINISPPRIEIGHTERAEVKTLERINLKPVDFKKENESGDSISQDFGSSVNLSFYFEIQNKAIATDGLKRQAQNLEVETNEEQRYPAVTPITENIESNDGRTTDRNPKNSKWKFLASCLHCKRKKRQNIRPKQ